MIVDFSVPVVILLAVHFTSVVLLALVAESESGGLRKLDIKPPSSDRSIHDESPVEDGRRSGTWLYWLVFAFLIGQAVGAVILYPAVGGAITAFLLIALSLFAAPVYKDNGGMYEYAVAIVFVLGGALGFILGRFLFHPVSIAIALVAVFLLLRTPRRVESGYVIENRHI